MFIINSLRPMKLGSFELRVGDNKFAAVEDIPGSVRERLVFFSEVPPQSERGILVFSSRDEATGTSQPVADPWASKAPESKK